jgi:Ca2+-binding RTX toxin-like protein
MFGNAGDDYLEGGLGVDFIEDNEGANTIVQ